MDCRAALERLEALSPGRPPEEPELAEAAAHLQSCPACEAIVERRQSWDLHAGRAIRDVPVPHGLKERLLAALAEAEADDSTPAALASTAEAPPPAEPTHVAPEEPSRAPSRRRVAFRAAIAAGLLAMIGFLGWQFLPTADAVLSLEQLRGYATVQPAELPRFDDSFRARPPGFGWRGLLAEEPLGLDVDGDGRHEIAVYSFAVRSRDRSVVRGKLLAIPRQRVAGAPQASMMSTANANYLQGRYAEVTWTEGDLVYVALVEGGRDNLERLEELLGGSRIT